MISARHAALAGILWAAFPAHADEVAAVVVTVRPAEAVEEAAVLWSTRVAVEAHEALSLVDVAAVLSSGGGEQSDAEAGRAALDEARAALAEVDVETAANAAGRAERLLLRADPAGAAANEALLLLAEIRLAERDEAGAVSALRRALLLDPHLRLGRQARPSMARALSAARQPPGTEIGRLRAESGKTHAAVLVDGRFGGVTPCTVAELDPGAHLVVFEADGYRREVRLVEVGSGETPVVKVELEAAPRGSLLARITDRLEDEAEADAAGPALRDLKGLFFAQQAILLDVDDHTARVTLFDLQAGRRVRTIQIDVDGDAGEAIVRRLYEGLDPGAPALAGVPAEPAPEDDRGGRGLTSRWWFWPAVGVAAAAAVAIPLLVLGSDDPEGLPREDGAGAVLITF